MGKAAASKDKLKRQALKLIEDKKVRRNNSKQWTVKSESSKGTKYRVYVAESGLKCDCPYQQERDSACKHTTAVEMLILDQAEEDNPLAKSIELSEIDPSKCFKCGNQCAKDGKKKHVHREPSQVYWCNKCKKHQTGTPGFAKRHYSAKVIALVILLFSMGMAPSGIVVVLREWEEVNVDISTVRRWANHYVAQVEQYTKELGVIAGLKWSVDEKYVKMSGVGRWLFSVMDNSTRFILSWDISHKKFGYNACGLFRRAVNITGHIPAILTSDKLNSFSSAFKKVIQRRRAPKPLHFAEAHVHNKYCTNNMHERVNSTKAEWIRTKRVPKTNTIIIKAFLLHYNFVRTHSELGMTPAKAAGINIKKNTWQVLVENAALAALHAA